MADIHQPLHVGFREDFGATLIEFPRTDNLTLHKIWDYDILNSQITKFYSARPENFVRYMIESESAGVFTTGNFYMSQELLEDGSFAAAIASETAQFVTCDYAYKNVDRTWIENGQLKPGKDYYQSRFRIITNQLMKAGVRLAQLLDFVAAQYKAAQPPRETTRVVSPLSVGPVVTGAAPPTCNRFAVLLNLDFDIEETAVTNVVEEAAPPVSESDDLATFATPLVVASSSRSSPKSSPKKKLSPKKPAPVRPKMEPIVRDGIRLHELTIVKRNSRLYITYPYRVLGRAANWRPQSSIPIQVRFRSDESVCQIFYLDGDVFRFAIEPSVEFLTDMFQALGAKRVVSAGDGGCHAMTAAVSAAGAASDVGIYLSDRDKKSAVSVMLGCGLTSSQLDDMRATELREAERLYSASRVHMSERDILRETRVRDRRSNEQYSSKIDDLVFISANRILLVTTYSKAVDVRNTTITVNRFDYLPAAISRGPEDANILYVDHSIFDEEMTKEIFYSITQLRKNPLYVVRSVHAIRSNRLLHEQLKTLSDAIFKNDYSKGPAVLDSFENFDKIIGYDKPYLRTFIIDYALLVRTAQTTTTSMVSPSSV